MHQEPKVSIITLNWNGRKLLGDLLDKHLSSLLNTDYYNFEVIFADNGSTDDSVKYVKSHYLDPKLKVLELRRNYGFAKGNNLALRAVDPNADIVVFINTDTIVDRKWLEHLVNAFRDPEIGVAQPLILDLESKTIQYIGGYIDQWGRSMTIGSGNDQRINELLLKYIRNREKPLRVLWTYGACIAVRKRILDRVGGFNDMFLFSHEELTLCIPAHMLGYKVVVVPKSIIFHRGRATIKYLHSHYDSEFSYNRFLFILLYYPFNRVMGSLIGRFLIELYLSFKAREPINVIKALFKLLANAKNIYLRRKENPFKFHDSHFLVKSPLVLSRENHIRLAMNKLLEVNSCKAFHQNDAL